jgi:hypothetical protein
MSPVGTVIMKFAHSIARVLKGMEIRAGRGGETFEAGATAPFVTSPSAVGSRAPTSLSRGGRDCRVVAASSIPGGVCSLHHGPGCLVVAICHLLLSHEWMVAGEQETWPKKDHCPEKYHGIDVILTSP